MAVKKHYCGITLQRASFPASALFIGIQADD